MWLSDLLQVLIEVVQWEQTPKPIRIFGAVGVSLMFFIGMGSMFLLAFLVEGQSLVMRGVWLILGIGMLLYYLYWMKSMCFKGKNR